MLLLDITNIADWKFGFANTGHEKKQIDRLCGASQKNKFTIVIIKSLDKYPFHLTS